jgi:hypothetical protein
MWLTVSVIPYVWYNGACTRWSCSSNARLTGAPPISTAFMLSKMARSWTVPCSVSWSCNGTMAVKSNCSGGAKGARGRLTGSITVRWSPNSNPRTSIIIPAMYVTERHTRARSPDSRLRACPVQWALVTICARVSRIVLGWLVEPEVCRVNVSCPDSQCWQKSKTRRS